MDLIEFIYESNKTNTQEELLSLFLKFLNNFGMKRFLMAELSHDSTSTKEKNFGVLFNYPQEWVDHYISNHYVDYDPVYQTGLISRKPFTWEDVKNTNNISKKSLQIMEEAKECKLFSGVGISIHQPLGRIIGMALAGDDTGARCDKNAISLMYAASNQFFTVYSDLMDLNKDSTKDISLTNREHEVLLWLARGKTKSDISDILSVSESTVKRYCESVFYKLDANNTPLAVFKALRMGLIKPF